MKKKLLGSCPICGDKLHIKTLKCDSCKTEITGEFEMSPFDYLSKEQLEFALIFIKCEGNIKAIEKNLNISYPTVKKNIEELVNALGFVNNTDFARQEVMEKLRNKEITFEEAEEILGGL